MLENKWKTERQLNETSIYTTFMKNEIKKNYSPEIPLKVLFQNAVSKWHKQHEIKKESNVYLYSIIGLFSFIAFYYL